MQIRKEILVSGIVQGVGFRPYIHRLATDRNLVGTICNTPSGVTIEVQGPIQQVEDFLERLPADAPLLSRILDVSVREVPCNGDREFQILASSVGDAVFTLISPDVAACGDCLRELFDPSDRRHLYPFINCTNCGPRFTIVRGIPYDRSRTSMAAFPLCEACRREYDDSQNRRFHAQPNACWTCGPRLALWDARGRPIETSDPIREAAQRLRLGDVVAVKGLGGFHLAVDATNPAAVDLLRRRKHRVEKPFAVMVPDIETAARICEVDEAARAALASRQRPIVLLPRSKDASVTGAVAPSQHDLGVFLPYTPLHHLLFSAGEFSALVMTSGNLSEEPIAIDNQEAATRLAGIADSFLVHNRDILLRCDDSVVRLAAGRLRKVRRSRGYVPAPVQLRVETPPVLAVGGELKNTICLTRGKLAFLSQHIGDLENLESYDFFREAAEHLSKILEIAPKIIAHDLHPGYFSTQWALAQTGVRRVGVQHHHAHVASCMAENGIEGKVAGLVLDGTGYGTDGHIWGGEILVADYAGFERACHLAYVPMPGGAAAIHEPWRMAVSHLVQAFGREFLEWDIPFVRGLDRGKTEVLLQMIDRQVNSPLTSSCGRLFDSVAAVIGIRGKVNYEAQSAIELEMLARSSCDAGAYPFDYRRENTGWEIGTRSLFSAIVEDLARNAARETIGRRFHNGLVDAFSRVLCEVREESAIHRVCLSGGVFQNVLVLEGMVRRLQADGFEVFAQAEVPAGDGGLSLGQALVAAHAAP